MPVGQYTNRPYSSFRVSKMTAPKSLTSSTITPTTKASPMLTPSERTQTHRCSFKSTSSSTPFSQMNSYGGGGGATTMTTTTLKPLTPKLCRKIDSFVAVKRQPCQVHTNNNISRSPATSSQTSDESIGLKYDIPLSTQVSQKRSYNTVKVPKTDKKPPVKKPNGLVLANKSTNNQQIKKKYKEEEKKSSFSSKFPNGLPFEDEFYYNRPRSYSQTSSNLSFHNTSISHDNFKNFNNNKYFVQKENQYIEDDDDEFTRKPSNDSLYVDFSKVVQRNGCEDDDGRDDDFNNNNNFHHYQNNNDFYFDSTKHFQFQSNQEKRKTTTTTTKTKTTFNFDLIGNNNNTTAGVNQQQRQQQVLLQKKVLHQPLMKKSGGNDSFIAVTSWIPKCQDSDDISILESTTSEYKLVSFLVSVLCSLIRWIRKSC